MIGAEEQDWGPADTFDMVPGGARMQVLVSISSSGPCMKVGSLDSFLTFSCSTTGLHVWMDGLMGRGKYGEIVVVGLAYRLFRLGPGAWGDAGKGKGDCGVQRAASARAPPSHPIVTSLLSLILPFPIQVIAAVAFRATTQFHTESAALWAQPMG